MAIAELYAGTQTVDTTEWDMTTDSAGPDADTTDGIIQAYCDLNALAAGDRFEFRFYEKVGSGSTQRLVYREVFDGVQAEAVFCSPSFIVLHGWTMTLIKIAGTDRAIDWSIRSVS